MKKLVSALGAASLILTAAGVASAASITDVSDGSSASISSKTWFGVKVSNQSNAYIKNTGTSYANTGNNKVTSKDDQLGTVLTTGNALSETLVSNTANHSSVSVTANGGCGCEDDLVTNISDESSGYVYNKDGLKVEIENDNEVKAENEVVSVADTGNNEVTSGDRLEDLKLTSGESLSGTGIFNLFNRSEISITRNFAF